MFKAQLQCTAWYEYDENTGHLINSSLLAGEPDFKYTVNNVDTQLQQLACNLLQCQNTVIAREAADIFYGRNTFAFLGDHNWDPIVSWLQAIGERNLNCLTKLNIDVRCPDTSFQRRDGSRVALPRETTFWPIYPRNSHLHVPSGPLTTGAVDNINPVIETMMAILSERINQKVLKIIMLLEYNKLPGLEMHISSNESGISFSRELPDLLEKFRADYTEDASGRSSIEILWVGRGNPWNFNSDRRREIKKSGWQIVELNQEVHLPIPMKPALPEGSEAVLLVDTIFVVKRRPVKGKIWASEAEAYGRPEDQY